MHLSETSTGFQEQMPAGLWVGVFVIRHILQGYRLNNPFVHVWSASPARFASGEQHFVRDFGLSAVKADQGLELRVQA